MESAIRLSFYITYVLLLTTGTITFIESLRTSIPQVRHIMNLETCISIIAAYFYGNFVKILDGPSIPYSKINDMRYTDWFITTPIMLLVLCLVLAFNNKTYVRLTTYLMVLVLNFAMLLAGYMGERGKIQKTHGLILGFIAFIAIYALIWMAFVRGSVHQDNYWIFGSFVAIWALYGVVYRMDEKTKNITFNGLDAVAKCVVGIFLWAYFTKVVVI